MGHFVFIEKSPENIQNRIYSEEGNGLYLKSIQQLEDGNFMMIFETNTDFLTFPIQANNLKDLGDKLTELSNERTLNVFKEDGTICRYRDLKIIRVYNNGMIEALLILESNSFA